LFIRIVAESHEPIDISRAIDSHLPPAAECVFLIRTKRIRPRFDYKLIRIESARLDHARKFFARSTKSRSTPTTD
jgi:hypothetical protein